MMNSFIHNETDNLLLQLSWKRPPDPSKRDITQDARIFWAFDRYLSIGDQLIAR
jgi:hypothetical protein